MERFIRYLYEYKEEKRIRNVGFVKVETGCEETIVHLQAKGFLDSGERKLILYLFYEENGKVIGIRQAEMMLASPVLSEHLRYSARHDRIRGILIETESGRRMAATWDDMPVNVSRMEEFVDAPEAPGPEEEKDWALAQGEAEEGPEPAAAGPEEEKDWALAQEREPYVQSSRNHGENQKKITKIQRKDITRLPRCEWRLANNKFLVHGYNNFHHLLLIENGNYLKLGVPGIYHIEEAKCAEEFGFEEFLSADEVGVFSESEETQSELFGYWCRPVRGWRI